MTHAELLRKHATDATNEGGMWFSGEYLSRIAETAESLEAENAKLRELIKDLYEDMWASGEWLEPYEQRMRELGIEVD